MHALREAVAEFQGLYGPFTIAERVLQKIWLRQDFDCHAARLADGRSLEVVSPGAWNLLGGPDFRAAQLKIGGREIAGDVEVHFRVSDWKAHAHASNPNYASVALHVVLFPPEPHEKPATNGADHAEIPLLALLPLLHRSLEEYAADDALETLTSRDEWTRFAELGTMSPSELDLVLRRQAEVRWQQKVRFAQMRIEKLGWTAAAHQTALEILGYRHNRPAMLALAARYPLEQWTKFEPDILCEENRGRWQLHGVRPANHPRTRLRQYCAWARHCPNWPERWTELARDIPISPFAAAPTREAREQFDLPKLREKLSNDFTVDSIPSTRFETLMCDGLLPLAAAHERRDLFPAWFHWYPGDLPDQIRRALVKLGTAGTKSQPLCHGFGQGLLGWLLAHEVNASR
ncbi:MAG TPA: DUF2851 family protein [Candidatus Didemnitutus sp.]|nr:DUF2851 family protein [Candidatus Didemnitutus sp.]